MTTSSLHTSRLSSAITELEQALSALDQTVNTVSQSLSEKTGFVPEDKSAPDPEMISVSQMQGDLVALRELVSGAAELIALARSGEQQKDSHPQEIH